VIKGATFVLNLGALGEEELGQYMRSAIIVKVRARLLPFYVHFNVLIMDTT
jgi:hypothetical protein